MRVITTVYAAEEEEEEQVAAVTEEQEETEDDPPEDEEEEEDEEDLEDPMDEIKEHCGSHCPENKEKLEACTDRVNSRTKTEENCTEELIDFLHCIDHCASDLIFKSCK